MATDRSADHWLWSAVEARTPVVPIAEPEVVNELPAAAESAQEAAPIDATQHEILVSTEIPKEQAKACPTVAEPAYTPDLFDEAAALHKIGRWEEALALYTRIPESDERYADALVNMIAISAARSDSSILREYGERLLRLRRQSRPALEALMQSAMATGDYKAAAQHGTRLVKHAADSHQAWFNLGLCYHKTSHYEQAAQAYTEAINLCPDGIRARANLGVLLQAHGDISGARREFEQVLEIEPDDLPTLWN